MDEVKANGRQPGGAEARLNPRSAIAAFGPSARPGRFGVRAAKAARPARTSGARRIAPQTRRGDRFRGSFGSQSDPGASGNSKSKISPSGGRAPSTDPSTRGRSLRSGPQRGVAVTGPRCRRGSDGERAISPKSPPGEREPPSRRKTAQGEWDRRAQKPPVSLPARPPEKRRPPARRQRQHTQCASAARGGADTWEGAERSGVGAQGPVAHPRDELQAEDLL